MNKSKYDEYGVLKELPWPNIKKGDKVGYIDTQYIISKNNGKTYKKKIQLIGYWDGEKVEFNDKEKTIVRSIRWLTNENVF